MQRIKVRELIVVEGKYDKIKLSSMIEGTIIETNGFSIMKDKEKIEYIKMQANSNGIIILTDSDGAGFKIRNEIKKHVDADKIKHVYIPDIYGKEKRKTKASAEGKLGVEGIDIEVLREAFNSVLSKKSVDKVNFLDNVRFYEDGFTGGTESANLRRMLAKELSLPERLSANALIKAINDIYTESDYEKAKAAVKNSKKED